MTSRFLVLDKLRRERNYTWVALSNATGIPNRTLQDIQAREAKKDITQIGSGVKKKLLKVAELWGLAYEDLFEPGASGEDEGENPEQLYQSLKDFIQYEENVSDEARAAYTHKLQARFVTGDFALSAMNMLAADETEMNGLTEKTVTGFVERCVQEGKAFVAEQLAVKLTDRRFSYKDAVLLYFAMALARHGQGDLADEIFLRVNEHHVQES